MYYGIYVLSTELIGNIKKNTQLTTYFFEDLLALSHLETKMEKTPTPMTNNKQKTKITPAGNIF